MFKHVRMIRVCPDAYQQNKGEHSTSVSLCYFGILHYSCLTIYKYISFKRLISYTSNFNELDMTIFVLSCIRTILTRETVTKTKFSFNSSLTLL